MMKIRTHENIHHLLSNIRGGIALSALAALLALTGRVEAQFAGWDAGGGEDMDWSNTNNWKNDALPLSTDAVFLGASAAYGVSDATSVVSQAGAVCKTLELGVYKGNHGLLRVTGGDVTAGGGIIVGKNANAAAPLSYGCVTQSEGIVTMKSGTMYIGGYFYPAAGDYYLSGGLLSVTGSVIVGYATDAYPGANTGRVYQSGGTFYSTKAVALGDKPDNVGIYELSGGLLQTTSPLSGNVGGAGRGVFTQTGGTNQTLATSSYLHIGYALGGEGVYNLFDGVWDCGGAYVNVGYEGKGNVNLGTSTTSGTWTNMARIVVRGSDLAEGTLQGWGTIWPRAAGASLLNNGRVIADGYGTADLTLDLSKLSFGAKWGFTFTSTNGWFAQNRGKLTLADVAYADPMCWGDSVSDQQLVNTAKFDFTAGVSAPLTGSLLASDHGDVHGGLYKPVGIWNFSGPSFADCALTIRYDDLKAATLGVAEADLKVFQRVSGAWQDITGMVNEGANTITADAVAPLSMIAVAVTPPPSGTVLIIR